jgi:hypothetical protein
MENNIQLTITDLASMRTLLEAAHARGAFRISESQIVGETYNKLSLFLEQHAQQPEADNTSPGE